MKRQIAMLLLSLSLVAGCGTANKNQQAKTQQTPQTADNTKIQTKSTEQYTARQSEQPAPQKGTPDLAGGKEKNIRQPRPMTLADLAKKYHSTFRLAGSRSKREVALTFDDGPDNTFTPQVLDVLKEHNVKATFFLIGNRVEAHPDIVKRILSEGHAIGNHSYSHPNLPRLKAPEFEQQIIKTENAIRPIAGYRTDMLRPPYGNINEEQIKWLASRGYTIVNWNVDSLDWKGISADKVRDNVLSNVRQGSIILQHCAGGKGEDLSGSVHSLPEIIDKLKADNVSFVTVPEMFHLPTGR